MLLFLTKCGAQNVSGVVQFKHVIYILIFSNCCFFLLISSSPPLSPLPLLPHNALHTLRILSTATKDLKSMQSLCQSLVLGDPLDALTDHQKVEDRVGRLRCLVKDLSLEPLIRPCMKAEVTKPCDEFLDLIQCNFKLTYDSPANVCRGGEGKEVKVDKTPDNQSGEDNNDSNSSSLSDVMCRYSSVSSEEFVSWQGEEGRGTQELSEGREASEEELFCPEMFHIRKDGSARSEATHLSTDRDQDWNSSSVIPSQSMGALNHQSLRSFNHTPGQSSYRSGSTSPHHTQLLPRLNRILDQLSCRSGSTSTHHTQLLPCDLPDYSSVLGESHLRLHVDPITDDSDLEQHESRDPSESRDVCVSGVGEMETTPNMMTDIMDRHWDMVDEVEVHNYAEGDYE